MESKVLENAVENFKNSLNYDDLSMCYQIPDSLRDVCKIYLIHEKTKSINFKNVPDNLLNLNVIDDYEKSIETIDNIIQMDTEGFFKELDSKTKNRMKHGDFRSLILGILYLKGVWYAYRSKLHCKRKFYNADESVTDNVEFFYFENLKVTINNNMLSVDVPYNESLENFVRFTIPYAGESRIVTNSKVCLPEVDITFRKEIKINPLTVINYRYQQDVDGFTAACVSCMDTYDGVRHLESFYFDKPFDVTIFYKNEELFSAHVDTIESK
ncbi:uncharacterized protein NPIL_138401 [Nephila pilipes]|uniref:Uncharacterized protein n=1 Tax=Nephila pilipes TaxID=299642 RepID=A0A8X6UFM6_NEPPI|nr:uncharacterized protein NPIL_138401 [Nephila pilipes]